MGFAETYVILLAVGVVLGLALIFASRVLLGIFRGTRSTSALLATLFFVGLLASCLALPNGSVLLQSHAIALAILGCCFSVIFLTTTTRPQRIRVVALVLGSILLSSLFLIVTAYAFVTGDFSTLRGEELVALVEVRGGELQEPLSREYPLEEHLPELNGTRGDEVISVSFPSRTPSVDLTVYVLEDGKVSSRSRNELPGNLWGIGGQVIEVDRWLLLFGGRTFYRLTTLDAKFSDNRLPHVGQNLPGFNPLDGTRKLEEIIPVIDRRLKELCSIRQVITDYDLITYTPVDRGQTFGLYAKRTGGFVPRPLDPEEFGRLLRQASE